MDSKNGMDVNCIILGECMEVMGGFAKNSIDTIITDPPYGLGFMGKEWDTFKPENIAKEIKWDGKSSPAMAAGRYDRSPKANTEFQRWFTGWGVEALRVLKPGGTLLIFGGTRTYHRLTCGIEDAGFIIKDCIMWLYGSGFPKATDISKQIDNLKFRQWLADNPDQAEKFRSQLAGAQNTGGDAVLHVMRKYKKLAGAEREVVGPTKWHCEGRQAKSCRFDTDDTGEGDGQFETEPATDAARLWDGWKSHGLKPAYEPIIVAMKPNDGSYANNALKHGVAGLHIDAGRIELDGDYKCKPNGRPSLTGMADNYDPDEANQADDKGRYPANVILDEAAAAMLDEQSGRRPAGSIVKGNEPSRTGQNGIYGEWGRVANSPFNDTGGASRFFYCAKASKSERNEGCDELEDGISKKYGGGIVSADHPETAPGGGERLMKNHHPTVKPLALMEYLCRITSTPSGGLVLDPFAGSGTTCMAAYRTGRDYIGIERDPEYHRIAEKRIAAEKAKLGLFNSQL